MRKLIDPVSRKQAADEFVNIKQLEELMTNEQKAASGSKENGTDGNKAAPKTPSVRAIGTGTSDENLAVLDNADESENGNAPEANGPSNPATPKKPDTPSRLKNVTTVIAAASKIQASPKDQDAMGSQGGGASAKGSGVPDAQPENSQANADHPPYSRPGSILFPPNIPNLVPKDQGQPASGSRGRDQGHRGETRNDDSQKKENRDQDRGNDRPSAGPNSMDAQRSSSKGRYDNKYEERRRDGRDDTSRDDSSNMSSHNEKSRHKKHSNRKIISPQRQRDDDDDLTLNKPTPRPATTPTTTKQMHSKQVQTPESGDPSSWKRHPHLEPHSKSTEKTNSKQHPKITERMNSKQPKRTENDEWRQTSGSSNDDESDENVSSLEE